MKQERAIAVVSSGVLTPLNTTPTVPKHVPCGLPDVTSTSALHCHADFDRKQQHRRSCSSSTILPRFRWCQNSALTNRVAVKHWNPKPVQPQQPSQAVVLGWWCSDAPVAKMRWQVPLLSHSGGMKGWWRRGILQVRPQRECWEDQRCGYPAGQTTEMCVADQRCGYPAGQTGLMLGGSEM